LANNNLQNSSNVKSFLAKVQNSLYTPVDFETMVSDTLPTIPANNFIKDNLETFFKLMQASHLYIDDDFEFEFE
jgi:hypothetical protein